MVLQTRWMGRLASPAGSRGAQRAISTRPATPASNSFFPVQSSPSASDRPARALPKPPTSLWYTSRPSLNAALISLSHSLTASRSHLFKSGLIPSIQAPLQGPEAEFGNLDIFKHPRSMRWKNSKDMAAYLRNGNGLRTSQYKRLTSLLGSLEGLLPYAEVSDRMIPIPGSPIPTLVDDPVAVANASLGGGSNGREEGNSSGSGGGLKDQLQGLLARFQQSKTFSASGEQVDRIAGKERRLGKIDGVGRIMAVGRRKESGARVWIIPTLPSSSTPSSTTTADDSIPGSIIINALPLPLYFPIPTQRASVVAPLSITATLGSFNVFAIAKGGGLAAQAEAVAMGIARALVEWERLEIDSGRAEEAEDGFRELLKSAKLLERDPRMVERKKTGQPKARKKNTWVKR